MAESLICSRARCNETARWALIWRNPRIHVNGRTKTWLACDEHLDFLSDYLKMRGFLLKTEPVEQLAEGELTRD